MYARTIDKTEVVGKPAKPAPKFEFEMVWLDAKTGEPWRSSKIDGLVRTSPFLGQWVVHDGRLVSLVSPAQAGQPDMRDIVQFNLARFAFSQPHSSVRISAR